MENVMARGVALYPRILGNDWTRLPKRLQHFHEGLRETRAFGRLEIHWGEGRLARLFARWGRLPGPGRDVEIELTVTPDSVGETWLRRFGSDRLVTRQWEEHGLLVECAGPFEFRFRLSVSSAGLEFHQTGVKLRLGRARIPLPRWIAPSVGATAWEAASRVAVRVEVSLPGVGSLCRYAGNLERRDGPT